MTSQDEPDTIPTFAQRVKAILASEADLVALEELLVRSCGRDIYPHPRRRAENFYNGVGSLDGGDSKVYVGGTRQSGWRGNFSNSRKVVTSGRSLVAIGITRAHLVLRGPMTTYEAIYKLRARGWRVVRKRTEYRRGQGEVKVTATPPARLCERCPHYGVCLLEGVIAA